jgi:hypothetical protein
VLLDFKKPNYIILEKVASYTGKYLGFLGTHYHKGILCFVVGSVNKLDGEVIARHFNADIEPHVNENAAKAAAQRTWNIFRTALVAKPQSPENDEQLAQWYDRLSTRLREIEARDVRKRSDA